MAIVSISKAAKITGKARSTIQSYIRQGKLSKTTGHSNNEEGIDTAELLRVFGAFKNIDASPVRNEEIIQHTAPNNTSEKDIKIIQLEAEVEKLKMVLNAKEKHIESLDNAMRLLEDQRQKPSNTQTEEPKKEESKGFFRRLLN